ncbi:putative D-2-hydroxyglutarate dehydrogenase, mitochondrial [Porphyridium purpureum]|uniref:Putative D-2-hydroxyglutarate dehydrogenase, mitochondrial n=1 Tax=Porphyridium purpureum TaxID=35688 RepID=A0A5J4YKE3_PORPP|nr:putative D-2-hydroxyglutarate dehydrogenase, mitochondrial [Porphyridium purpureum]|eukprot:POR0981..scf244_11
MGKAAGWLGMRCLTLSTGPKAGAWRRWMSVTPNVRKVEPKRDARYGALTDAHAGALEQLVGGSANVITDEEHLKAYNSCWMNKFHGQSKLVLRPRSTEQVSAVVAYCNEHRLALVPQGGNTGLVGGSVPLFDEIILSLGKMDKIESFDDISGVAVTQAGVVLETLDTFVGERGYRVPLDLGAKGSCQIGGNVATHAGGSRFVKYGSLRNSVLGMEVVTGDGTVIDSLKVLKKDNTGYDLKSLFIGSEGTLGIITQLSIACVKRPHASQVALFACESFDSVKKVLPLARTRLGETLSAIEFMDGAAVQLALKHLHHVEDPMPGEQHPFYVLVEAESAENFVVEQLMDRFVTEAFEAGLAVNGVMSQNDDQKHKMWALRESLPEAVQKSGNATFKYDVSLPMDAFYALVEDTRSRVRGQEGVHCVGWGHIGDGNLHLNLSAPSKGLSELLEPWVYEWVSKHRGSISAEHGLGQMKNHGILYSRTAPELALMRQLKQVFDPNAILNPYKMLPLV